MSVVEAYGRWPSPLSVGEVAAGRIARSGLASDGTFLYWLEARPQDGGRVVLMRAAPGSGATPVLPAGTSVRSKVHEYGGGAYCLVASGTPGSAPAVAYVDERDQRIYLWEPGDGEQGGTVTPLTPAPPEGERWAHGGLCATGEGRWVIAVREREFLDPPGRAPDRCLVWVALRRPAGGPPHSGELRGDRDFFGAGRPSPSGRWLAWTCWDHPQMPWDGSELWVGAIEERADGGLGITAPQRVDGGHDLWVSQPVWLSDDLLVYLSDREAWLTPWRWDRGELPCPLAVPRADFGGPDWQLGQCTLVALDHRRVGCVPRQEGMDRLAVLDVVTNQLQTLDQPCVSISALCAHRGGLAWLGATPVTPPAVWSFDAPEGAPAVVSAGAEPTIDPDDVSVAQPMTVTTESGRVVHALFYRPRNHSVRGPSQARPPLIVVCHGGPTGAADAGFDPAVQLFTTRGYAVVAVNYAGSSGYGRAYRRALEGGWGVVDVEDCAAVAAALAAQGRVDGRRMVTRGASAGGFSALACLVRTRVFAGAVSWYGVTDLESLAASTHDFESHYLDRLVGLLPEAADRYRERSPLHRVDDLAGAVLVLQGLDDRVVPPEQAVRLVGALRSRGVRCEYRGFAGEGHGFRQAATLQACYEAELAFYDEVLALGDLVGD